MSPTLFVDSIDLTKEGIPDLVQSSARISYMPVWIVSRTLADE